MMELLKDLTICCDNCRASLIIPKTFFDVNTYSESHGENGMGDEVVYLIDDSVKCAECGNEISIKIHGSEYPAGAFDSENSDINGGTFTEKPHMIIKALL